MGHQASRPVEESEVEEVGVKRERRASRIISKITLFVVVGDSSLFEVKRTQRSTLNETSQTPDIQISIRQLPIAGNPVSEGNSKTKSRGKGYRTGLMAMHDLASIKLRKVRRNSIHAFALNFDQPTETKETPNDGWIQMDMDFKENGKLGIQLNVRDRMDEGSTGGRDEDGDSESSDGSMFALQISKLAASVIESENESVEKWGEKLAKSIESKIGQPTSVVIQKSKRSKKSKKASTSAEIVQA